MKSIISKINTTARLLTIMMVAVVSLASCSSDDDEIVREGLTQNGITLVSSTVSSLSFSWEAVENATQYGYRLLDTDGNAVDGGVTTGTTASFTGLDDDTEYTFELTSFAAYNGNYSNGEAKTINVETDEIVPLAAPVLTAEVNYEKVSISWNAVENAETYYVKVTASDESVVTDTITATSYSFTGTVGLTYTVSVSADTDAEAYSQSEWSTTEELVPTENPRTEIWRVEGQMDDQAYSGDTYNRTMIAYDDGTYEIKDFLYTGSGCDLQFKVASDNTLDIQNGEYDSQTGNYILPWYPDYNIEIYPWYYSGYDYYYSYFDAANCKLYFYVAGGDYVTPYTICTFTWNADDIVYPYGKRKKLCDVTYGSTSYPSRFDNVTNSSIYIVNNGGNKFVWTDFLGSGVDLLFTVDVSNSNGEFDPNDVTKLKGDIVPLNYYYKDSYGYHFMQDGSDSDYVTWTPTGQTEAVTSFYFYGYYSGHYSYIEFDPGSYGCGYGYFWSAYVNGANYENIYFFMYY